MSTDLASLHAAFAASQRNGEVIVTAGAAGAPILDNFLATLPLASLTLRNARVELSGRQRPTGLVVSGDLAGTWPLPGPATAGLALRHASISYTQDRPDAPVIAALEVEAALTVAGQPLPLRGTLPDDTTVEFAWTGARLPGLPLAGVVTAAAGGQADSYLPAGLPALASMTLTSCTASVSYVAGATTRLSFGLTADPAATWEIVPGKHVLRQLKASVVSTFRYSAAGSRACLGGSIGAVLDLSGDVAVDVALAPGHSWAVSVLAADKLPSLQALAALTGVDADVQAGLRAAGLTGFRPSRVTLFVDRAARTLQHVAAEGSAEIAGLSMEVQVTMPSCELCGTLMAATPPALSALLRRVLGDPGGLPDVPVSDLGVVADARTGSSVLVVSVADDQLEVGGFKLGAVSLEVTSHGTELSAELSASIDLDGSELAVSGRYGPGWILTADLDEQSARVVRHQMWPDLRLPGPIAGLALSNLTATWDLATGSAAVTARLGGDLIIARRGQDELTLADATLELTADPATVAVRGSVRPARPGTTEPAVGLLAIDPSGQSVSLRLHDGHGASLPVPPGLDTVPAADLSFRPSGRSTSTPSPAPGTSTRHRPDPGP